MTKIIFIIFTYLLSYSTYAVCLNKKMQYDLKCKCSDNKSCYNFSTKTYKKSFLKATKNLNPKTAKKLNKYSSPILKESEKIFSKNFNYKEFNYKQIDDLNKRYDKLIAKLKPKIEKQLKKSGFKTYKLDKRVKKLIKYQKRGIPEKVKKYVASNGLSFAKIANRVGMKGLDKAKGKKQSSTKAVATNTDATSRPNQKELISPKRVKRKSNIQYKDVSSDVALALRDKNYKVAKLHEESKNLFQEISKKYQSIFLDEKNVSKFISEVKINKLKASFREIIDKKKHLK